MNRKQRIIVSITGIILVSLILIGLTYAYFLTKITGNTNTKSISVSTANLELVYGDGTNQILTANKPIEPSSDLTSTGAIGTKNFTVTNKGDDTDYSVVLENMKVTNATDGSVTTFESNDFVYTLICTSSDETNSPCTNQIAVQQSFPLINAVLLGNNIKNGVVHTYTLTLWYKDTGENQTNDMNKKIEGKINIIDIRSVNPYLDNKNTLAYNIINNASLTKNDRSKLSSSPNIEIGKIESAFLSYMYNIKPVGNDIIGSVANGYCTSGYYFSEGIKAELMSSGTIEYHSIGKSIPAGNGYSTCDKIDQSIYKYAGNMCIDGSGVLKRFLFKGCDSNGDPILQSVTAEKTIAYITPDNPENMQLIAAQDDYGTSYYYRGSIFDNYVNFAGMCWKIIRINGDGSTKLYLVDKNATCSKNTNYDNASIGNGMYGYSTTSDSKSKLDYVNSEISGLADIFKNFQTTSSTPNISNYLKYLKVGGWCVDAYDRSNITLKCDETLTNKFSDNTDMYVGTLTADEFIYAGTIDFANNSSEREKDNIFYLNYGYSLPTLSFMKGSITNISNDSMLVAPFAMYAPSGKANSYVYSAGPFQFDSTFAAIPAINLKAETTITSGDGTLENPYIIKTT